MLQDSCFVLQLQVGKHGSPSHLDLSVSVYEENIVKMANKWHLSPTALTKIDEKYWYFHTENATFFFTHGGNVMVNA